MLPETIMAVAMYGAVARVARSEYEYPRIARRSSVSQPALPPWGSSLVPFLSQQQKSRWEDIVWTPSDSLGLALQKVGLDDVVPRSIVAMAREYLAKHGFPDVTLHIQMPHDPEENATFASVTLSVPTEMDRVMDMELELTREIVRRFPRIPYAFSLALEAA